MEYPDREILRLNQMFLMIKEFHYYWMLDLVRTKLAKYTKTNDHREIQSKTLKERTKKLLGIRK